MRVKAVISYDGSKFFGFQKQKNIKNTVVEQLEKALNSIGNPTKVVGSGRTDRGVHATAQVIHFDLTSHWQKKDLNSLKHYLNRKLNYIKIKYLKYTKPDFHAQYSAKIRVYRYIIKTIPLKIFEQDYVSYYNIKNISLFKEALNLYIGKHNFKYLKKEGSYTSSDIREIKKIKIIKRESYYVIYFFANGYLRSQIRMMIQGALLVANGKLTLNQLKLQIEAKEKFFSTLATHNGLYLNRVFY